MEILVLFWLLLGGRTGNVYWPGPTPIGLETFPTSVSGLILRRKHRIDLTVCGQVFERVGCVDIVENGWANHDLDTCFQLLKAIDGSGN